MDIFIARQPIFDREQRVFAYELLFRSGFDNVFSHQDVDQATKTVIGDSVFVMGINQITGGKRGFINATRDTLVNGYISLLPSEHIAAEVLEDVEPDADVIQACKELKDQGYLVILDDFVFEEKFRPLIDLANIIKVDFLSTELNQCKYLIEQFGSHGIQFLAEKVESHQVFLQAKEIGYQYFQGHFFSKPYIIKGKRIPAYKLNNLQLIREVQNPEMDFGRLEEIIKHDVSLTYKLLKYINSAFFGLRVKIKSIRHALVLLGLKEVRKWVSLVAIASMGDDKPAELVAQAIIRAKFCDGMAPLINLSERSDDLFLLGMLSLIDSIMDQRMEVILTDLPLDDDVKSALLGETNRLQEVLEYVITYTEGNWDRVKILSRTMGFEDEQVPSIYADAVNWGNQSINHGDE